MESKSEAKRAPLEALSKEDLVQKCKALLSIAQRAKIAKDEAIEEAKCVKEKLEAFSKEKSNNEAISEVVESLTAQKLHLTIELDKSNQTGRLVLSECESLRASNLEQEVLVESLRRQLTRSETDCTSLEARLERLDTENRRLVAVANEAEAQLRRGAVERQDVLEGMGDELANIKNAAAEARAERDRLKAQLQQQTPRCNMQALESCHLVVQELRSSQGLLRSDVTVLQVAAQEMGSELEQALALSQAATEEAAQLRSKDLMAEMNEAMKTRGEVAAQLAERLSNMEKTRDDLLQARKEDAVKISALDKKCQELLKEISLFEIKNNTSTEAVEKLHSELSNLNQIKKKEREILEQKIVDIQMQEKNSTVTISNLQEQLLKFDVIVVEKNELIAKVKNLEKISSNLQVAIDVLNSKLEAKENLEEKIVDLESHKRDTSGFLSALQTQYESVIQERDDLLEKISDLEANNKECCETTENLITTQEKLSELESLREENERLLEEIANLQTTNISSSDTIIELKKELAGLNGIQEQCDMLRKDLESIRTSTTTLSVSDYVKELKVLENENEKLRNINEEMKQNNDELSKNVNHMQESISTHNCMLRENENLQKQIEHLKSKYEIAVSAETNLEKKLTQFNFIQEENRKLLQQAQDFHVKYSQITQDIQKKCTLIELSSKESEFLKSEIAILQSKNEKLEGIVVALESTLLELKNEKLVEENLKREVLELQNKNEDISEKLIALQEKLAEIEREREECEGASVSTISRTEDAARLRDVEESFEERYTKLRAVAIKLKQKCHDQAGLLTQVLAERTELQKKMATLSKERDTLAKNLHSIQAACDSAQDEMEAAKLMASQSEKQLCRAGEELAKARNQQAEASEKNALLEGKLQQALSDLETAKQESKQSGMLSLEVADYEKSSAEQDRKLTQAIEECESIRSELECQKSISNERSKEIKKLEDQSQQLIFSKTRMEEQFSRCKEQLVDSQKQQACESQRYSQAVAKFEAKRSEMERLEINLAELTAEKIKSEEDTKNFKELAARQIRILEDQVKSAVATVKDREDELSNLRMEFEGYKVRAQAVLHRQQQQQQPQRDEDASKEAERVEEFALLQTTVERLQQALCDAGGRERLLQAEIVGLSSQNSATQSSIRDLSIQISEYKIKCDDLASKTRQTEELLRESNRQHRLALDTLASSYKLQLSEAESRHKLQLVSIQAAQQELASQTLFPQEQEQPVLLQREEGEGSENVDSPKLGTNADNRREPLSLERLLSTSSEYHDDVKSEISLDAASVSSVLAAERRAKHLSALLGEAEADLARLTQQNSVLKEEIRRQQRCTERQQHTLSNGEYLKNVVLKFVTLQGGDERARLVPVLNTILKLSPEETQQLQTVANGAMSPPPGTAGGKSWGSYLHLWSGAQ